MYGKIKNIYIRSIESFDPRPEIMRNTSSDRVPTLLQDVKGKGLCVSLLLDASVCVEIPEETTALMKTELLEKVANFKNNLKYPRKKCAILKLTHGDNQSHLSGLRHVDFALTASLFGRVKQLKPSTPPDNLVLTILGVKKASGAALDYGRLMEATALDAYIKGARSRLRARALFRILAAYTIIILDNHGVEIKLQRAAIQ